MGPKKINDGLTSMQRHYRKHREKVLARSKRSYRAWISKPENKARRKLTTKKWGKDHPEKRRQYAMNLYHRRMDTLRFIKEITPCADCHQRFPHFVMQFDHINGFVEKPLRGLASRGWDTLADELSKCEVVCANCHCIRTWNRRQLCLGGNHHTR